MSVGPEACGGEENAGLRCIGGLGELAVQSDSRGKDSEQESSSAHGAMK